MSQQRGHTWYLLVELKGISATFLFLSLMAFTEPQDSSMHFSRADSEASPATSRLRMGKDSWPALNTARLQRAAMRAKDTHVVELLSKEEPGEKKQQPLLPAVLAGVGSHAANLYFLFQKLSRQVGKE